MRFILSACLVFLVSNLTYAELSPYSMPPISTFSRDMNLEEQNGKLMFPIIDPKTGKYTYDLERGRQIVEQRLDSYKNTR